MADSQSHIVLFAIAAVLFIGAGVLFTTHTPETNHQYEVKTEQVQSDAATVNESVQLDDLPTKQSEIVFDAWKKSDHFLGGSSTYVSYDERLNLTSENRWHVVEIEGVKLLVGIFYDESWEPVTAAGLFTILLTILGVVTLFFALEERKLNG